MLKIGGRPHLRSRFFNKSLSLAAHERPVADFRINAGAAEGDNELVASIRDPIDRVIVSPPATAGGKPEIEGRGRLRGYGW